jgi:hypothetical protein
VLAGFGKTTTFGLAIRCMAGRNSILSMFLGSQEVGKFIVWIADFWRIIDILELEGDFSAMEAASREFNFTHCILSGRHQSAKCWKLGLNWPWSTKLLGELLQADSGTATKEHATGHAN